MEMIPEENENSISWIENLALEELNMTQSGVITMHNHLNPNVLFEDSSINLMKILKKNIEICIKKFNQYKKDETSKIKIFKIANTINDFMLFRNSLRLIFTRISNDKIIIKFMITGKEPINNNTYEINASLGAFNKVSWSFQGEPIDIDSLIKHYLSEFIISSIN